VIGRNGAGKSTLLRLLAGLSQPTGGRVLRRGSLRALLDLGAGFLDEMTGAENARAVLALDGVPPREREVLLERAIEFAEIGPFVDQPMRTYSSGMRLRLGYALAIASAPDVLLTDEILAVGDESFQRKCSQHIAKFLADGGTMVLASHNLFHVEKLCQRAIWLDHGQVMEAGPVRQVTSAYRAAIAGGAESAPAAPGEEPEGATRPAANSDAIDVVGADTGMRGQVHAGETIRIAIRAGLDLGPRALLQIRHPEGTVVAQFAIDERRRTLRIDALPLLAGRYLARVASGAERAGAVLAEAAFDCIGASRELGAVHLRHDWDPRAVS
jgi:lipopolysaccharide transport system ATP-binding protein